MAKTKKHGSMSKHKFDRISISPMSRDILWMLEEAGEEDVECIINTLVSRKHNPQDEVWITEIATALRMLVKNGFVEISIRRKSFSENNDKKILDMLLEFHAHFYFDPVRALWIESSDNSEERISIIITLKGMQLISPHTRP